MKGYHAYTLKEQLFLGVLEGIPGDTIVERITWLRNAFVEQKAIVHDIQNWLTLQQDLGKQTVKVHDVLREVWSPESIRRGGETYRGLTMVDQEDESDCLRACIASLTGVPYEDCVDVTGMRPDEWRGATEVWAKKHRGRWVRRFSEINWPLNRTSAAFIGLGASPRRNEKDKGKNHAVLVDRWGDLVFDPHYSRRGLTGPVLEAWQWSVDLSHI